MEKPQLVDQRRRRVLAFIRRHAEQLARQGTVVSSFRCRGGRTVGPYYRLAFRQGSAQASLYLGNSAELVAEVRSALERLQRPHRQRRALMRQKKTIRRALAECRAELNQELARRGWWLRGYEVRGLQTPRPRTSVACRDRDGQQPPRGIVTAGHTRSEAIA